MNPAEVIDTAVGIAAAPIRGRVIMGIDPGVSTGVAFAIASPATPGGFLFDTLTIKDHQQVWDLIRPPVTVVVIEQFATHSIDKYGLHTVEVVGGAMALAVREGIAIERDTPQERRAYLQLSRRMVKKGVGHTIHEVDALAHVLRYMYHNVPEAGIQP